MEQMDLQKGIYIYGTRKNRRYCFKVLQKYEQTRSDDFVLVYAVYREINFNVATIDRFSEVMLNHKKYGFPSFGSVTRARRKIFETHPELKPTETTKRRKKAEEEYKEYSKSWKITLKNSIH